MKRAIRTLLSATSRARSKETSHVATYASPRINLTFTQEIIGPFDLGRTVSALLRDDVVLTAAWPSEDIVRICNAWAKVGEKIYGTYKLFDEYDEAQGSSAQAARFAIRHPGMVVGAQIRKWRGGRVSEGGRDSADVEGLAMVRESLEEAERPFLQVQALSALERHIDASLYGGLDHIKDSFARLLIEPTQHRILIPGVPEAIEATFEPRVVLHEAGVLQITIALVLGQDVDGESLVRLLRSTVPIIECSRGRMGAISRLALNGEPLKVVEGQGASAWVELEHSDRISIWDVFQAYALSIAETSRTSCGKFLVYPTLMVSPGSCCDLSLWRDRHASEIGGLTYRLGPNIPINSQAPMPQDLSVSARHSFYANEGAAVHLAWNPVDEPGVRDLETVIVPEYASLQFMRLWMLEERVLTMTNSDRELNYRYEEAVRVAAQLRQGIARNGEIRRTAAHILECMGAQLVKETIDRSLSLNSAHFAVGRSSALAVRAIHVSALAAIVAIVVAIPSFAQILKDSKSQPPNGPAWLSHGLQWLVGLGFWGPWVLLLALIVPYILLAFLFPIRRKFPRVKRRAWRGATWPTDVAVVEEETRLSGGR